MGKFMDFLLGVQPKDDTQEASAPFSIGDPAFAAWLNEQGITWYGGTDKQALGITAVWRAVSIISGTIAGLPLKVYRQRGDVRTELGSHWLRKYPAGPYKITSFSWKETVLLHLLLRGETFLLHVRNGADAIIGLFPVHPLAVTKVEWQGADKVFTVQLDNGEQKTYDSTEMTQIMALSTDGLRGESPLTLFAKTISTSLASELAANNHMTTGGGMLAGLVTPDGDIKEAEAKEIKAGLDKKLAEKSGGWAVVNRALKFSPLAMTHAEAQFLESRAFQVEEIARMFGVPPHLLAQTEKQTSWGSGVAEQNLGLARYTLMGWTGRIEEAISNILPSPQFVEFSYKGLLQGTPTEEVALLINQVDSGLMTRDEARGILNMPPLTDEQKAEAQPARDRTIDG